MGVLGKHQKNYTHIVDKKKIRGVISEELISIAKNMGEDLNKHQNKIMKLYISHYFDKIVDENNPIDPSGAYYYFYNSLKTDYKVILNTKDGVVLRMTSWFDKRKLSYPESLIRQQRNRGIYLDVKDPKQYVFDLMYKQGIVGLPEYFTHVTINGIRQDVPKYENPYFAHYKSNSTGAEYPSHDGYGKYMGLEEYIGNNYFDYMTKKAIEYKNRTKGLIR